MAQSPEQQAVDVDAGSVFANTYLQVTAVMGSLEGLVGVGYGTSHTDKVISGKGLYVRAEPRLTDRNELTEIVGVVLAVKTLGGPETEVRKEITVFHGDDQPKSTMFRVLSNTIAAYDPEVGIVSAPATTPFAELGVRGQRTIGMVAGEALARLAIFELMLQGERHSDFFSILGHEPKFSD